MGKIIFSAALFSCLLGASLTNALTIDDVGGVDKLIAETALVNSGDDEELAWIQTILGSDYDWADEKYDVTENDWESVYITDGTTAISSVFATSLQDNPEFFMLKIANPHSNPTTDGMDHFLFQNLYELEWAVVNLDNMDFEVKFLSNIGKVSHIGEVTSAQPVPEPTTLVLIGTGLASLIGSQLRRKDRMM